MAVFIEFGLVVGCGGVLLLMSQLSDVLQFFQFGRAVVVRIEDDWERFWRREAERQRRNQRWREMWQESDEEDYENYADFLGEFEELTWSVEELFEEYCEGWYIVNEAFGGIEIDEDEEENWDI